jgi:hypothetical protein
LADRGELAAQTLVEIFDDFGVALHDALSLTEGLSQDGLVK